METILTTPQIFIGLGAIIATIAITLVIKKLFYKYKRPNGKKGGFISLHVALAFSIVAVVAVLTRDWFITLLMVLLAYLISKGRLDEGQHYLYQIVIGGLVGLAVPYAVFYIAYRKVNPFATTETFEDRPRIDKPERAKDDREEADREGADLKLDDD